MATTVGRVTVVAWPDQGTLALGLAERADRASAFPGVGALPPRPIRLILAPSRAAFDSITRQRLPPWSEGAAFPDAGVIVLLSSRPSDRLTTALRHELAHVALRWTVRGPLPLWFEEGYAAVAAGEWDRLDALRLNWHVARGLRMDLDQIERALRAGEAEAEAAYALAATAVLLLQRWGGPRGLDPLIVNLADARGLDGALRATYHLTAGDFETRWRREVATRYGWLAWASAVGLYWTVLTLLLVALWSRRRRRDRAKRARLDEEWAVPGTDSPTA